MDTWFVERRVGDIRPGDHAWLPFSSHEERDHIVGAFVQDGLTRAEMVVYVGDRPAVRLPGPRGHDRADRADRATRSAQGPRPAGRLRVFSREQACLTRGHLDPDRMLTMFEHQITDALDEGFRAVRVTADLSWALGEPGGPGLLLECEKRLAAVVAPGAMAMAVCQVDRGRCSGDQLAALMRTHDVLLAANPEFDDGVLSITRTFAPYGIRLEGEIDAARHAVFADALAAVTAGREQVHLDLAGVRFVDLGALSLVAAYGVRAPAGHGLVLDHVPPDVAAVIEIVGWHRLPGLTRGRTIP